MKLVGIIGGMSWESTAEYYRLFNEGVKQRLGGFHSARLLIYSVDFAEIERLQHEGRWDKVADRMIEAARALERAGAELLLLATNTVHKLAEQIQAAVSIPFLHIADATASRIKEKGIKRVGLLGTKFTMEEDFYKERLRKLHGIEVVIPEAEERDYIHSVIYNELCLGIIKEESRRRFIEIIENLRRRGAEGIVLGCTEIPLLIKQEHVPIPVFDTTRIHVEAALDRALQD